MPDDLREQFLLDPGVAYLNHGSFGACPRSVFERYQEWQRELEREPMDFFLRRLPGLLRETQERLAAYVGARPDDVVLVPNATTGVNTVARSLALAPGDEVLGTDHEYGGCVLAWGRVCAGAGARYVTAELPLPVPNVESIVDAIWARVTERTRVIFLSHVTSATALVLPVAEICGRAREAGILTVVDGAHAPGQLPLELDALGADFYAGNCHKWLCAPKGAGFLWVAPEHQARTEALVVSWGYAGEATFQMRHGWPGTRDPAAYLTIPAAIDWQEANGWEDVRSRCHELARAARTRLAQLTGHAPLAPDSRAHFVQMVAAELPECEVRDPGQQLHAENPTDVASRLYREHRVEPLVHRWRARPLIRVSFQGYNSNEDLDRLIDGLGDVLSTPASARRRGRRARSP